MDLIKKHLYNIAYHREHREEIREKRRLNRDKENAKRRLRMGEIIKKNREHARMMGYTPLQQRTRRMINKLWIRPKSCPICWYECTPVAHHPDYNKPYEIIFCCNSCHKLIHLWQLNIDESKIIKLCENDGERQLIKCNICWTSIRNIWGAKYCDKCRVIANRLAQKRFNEKKKLLKLL